MYSRLCMYAVGFTVQYINVLLIFWYVHAESVRVIAINFHFYVSRSFQHNLLLCLLAFHLNIMITVSINIYITVSISLVNN